MVEYPADYPPALSVPATRNALDADRRAFHPDQNVFHADQNVCESIWDKIKRVRTGIKGMFGDDSSEYEMVGGTRLSDHKPRSRKKEVG